MKLGYSTCGFVDRDVEAALDAIAAAGYDHTEVLGQDPHVAAPPLGSAAREFAARLESRGFLGGTVHAPMRRNVLGAPDEDWRREKVQVLAAYVRFAAAIGFSGVVVHPVPNPIFVPEPERPELPERISEATRRSLDDLVPVAVEAGTRVLLENLPYDCAYPFLTMDELRPLVDAYPDEALGLVIDTGHAWTSGLDPADQIRAGGPRLWGTHLQDVDHEHPQDDHWAPTHGGLDWVAIREALREVGYAGLWTFEVMVARHGESPDDLATLTRGIAAGWDATT